MNAVPVGVLVARLAHELQTAEIYAEAERADMALRSINKAQSVLSQIKEATR